jgi:hypothetical protein
MDDRRHRRRVEYNRLQATEDLARHHQLFDQPDVDPNDRFVPAYILPQGFRGIHPIPTDIIEAKKAERKALEGKGEQKGSQTEP